MSISDLAAPLAAFIREIEVYKATHCVGLPLRVYFMMYDNSVEEQQYLTQLKKEKQAFERLIFEKAHLNIPASPGRGNVVAAASAGVLPRLCVPAVRPSVTEQPCAPLVL